MKKNILFTGVGGQGVLTVANILAKATMAEGLSVLTSEVHGMAQRGGGVVCHVRIGDVYAPLIQTGGADAIVSMEPLEALRNIHKVKENGLVITDITKVIPQAVTIGKEVYPPLPDLFRTIEDICALIKIDGLTIAKTAGHAIARNIVMLGALAGCEILPVSKDRILLEVKKSFQKKYVSLNEKAFVMGSQTIRNQ
jgi:indolepyruvate ferredoxin oxidoreductase beta subunit